MVAYLYVAIHSLHNNWRSDFPTAKTRSYTLQQQRQLKVCTSYEHINDDQAVFQVLTEHIELITHKAGWKNQPKRTSVTLTSLKATRSQVYQVRRLDWKCELQ